MRSRGAEGNDRFGPETAAAKHLSGGHAAAEASAAADPMNRLREEGNKARQV